MIGLKRIGRMMRRIGTLGSICVAVLGGVMVSCVEKIDLRDPSQNKPDQLTLQFKLDGAVDASLASRAVLPGENQIDDIAIWLFDQTMHCISYHYLKAEDQSAAEQTKWGKEGLFTVRLEGAPAADGITAYLVVANTANLKAGTPVAANQVGRDILAIDAQLTTKASSTDNPVVAPFPMGSYWYGLTDQGPNVILLGRTVGRVNVSITVDETQVANLRSKLDLTAATVRLENMVEFGSALYQNIEGSNSGEASDCQEYDKDPRSVKFYKSQREPFVVGAEPYNATAASIYLNQRYDRPMINDRGNFDTNRAVFVLVQIPYKDEAGEWQTQNYYKVPIYDPTLNQDADKYAINPNRSYNMHLTVNGWGADRPGALTEMMVRTTVTDWNKTEINAPIESNYLNVSSIRNTILDGTKKTRVYYSTDFTGAVTVAQTGTTPKLTITHDAVAKFFEVLPTDYGSSNVVVTAGKLSRQVGFLFNATKGFAGSNVYWDKDFKNTDGTIGRLTFKGMNERSSPEREYQGVFFTWGSLVAISPIGAWHNQNSILYAPGTLNQAGNPWTPKSNTSWTDVPRSASFANADLNRTYLLEIHNQERNIGDVCKLITDKGWAPSTPNGKGWRMPKASEFSLYGLPYNPGTPPYATSVGTFTDVSGAMDAYGTGRVKSGYMSIDSFRGTYIPASANRYIDGRIISSAGTLGTYWSSTPRRVNGPGYMHFSDGGLYAEHASDSDYYAQSIRCVAIQ